MLGALRFFVQIRVADKVPTQTAWLNEKHKVGNSAVIVGGVLVLWMGNALVVLKLECTRCLSDA